MSASPYQAFIDQTPTSMPDVIQQLIESYNAEAFEFDALADKLEARDARIAELEAELKKIHADNAKAIDCAKAAEQIAIDAMRIKNENQGLKTELSRTKVKLASAEDTAKRFKELGATPKKVRERIKNLEANTQKWREKGEAKDKLAKSYRADYLKLQAENRNLTARAAQSSLFAPVPINDKEMICMYPLRHNQHGEDQVQLMYFEACGRGRIVIFNEDGEAMLKPVPKTAMRPSAKALDIASVTFRRLKDKNWQVDPTDVEYFEGLAAEYEKQEGTN